MLTVTTAESTRVVKLLEAAIKLLDRRSVGPCGDAVLAGLQQQQRNGGDKSRDFSIIASSTKEPKAAAQHAESAGAAILPLVKAFACDQRLTLAVPWIHALSVLVPSLSPELLIESVIPLASELCRVENQEAVRLACCDLCVQLAVRLGSVNSDRGSDRRSRSSSSSSTVNENGEGGSASSGSGSGSGSGSDRRSDTGSGGIAAADDTLNSVMQTAILALCHDVAVDVRVAMCKHLGSLFAVLSQHQQLAFLIPTLTVSLDDEEAVVRRCAYTALADGTGESLQQAVFSASAAPLMALYAMPGGSDNDRVHSGGCSSNNSSSDVGGTAVCGDGASGDDGAKGSGGDDFSSDVGGNVTAAATAKTPHIVVGFDTSASHVAADATGHLYDEMSRIAADLIGKVAFNLRSFVTNVEMSNLFLFFGWLHADAAPLHHRQQAAFNLPAMLVVLAHRHSLMEADAFETLAEQLETALTALLNDGDPTVRRIVAAGYHEICKIAPTFGRKKRTKFYTAGLIRMLRDTDATVLVAVAPHLDDALTGLVAFGSNGGSTTGGTSSASSTSSTTGTAAAMPTVLSAEIMSALRQCYDSLGPHWRSKVQLLKVFQRLPEWFASTHAFSKIAPCLSSIILSIDPRPPYRVQQAALRASACLVRNTRRHEQRDYFHEWTVTELAEGQSAWLRMLYIDLCSHAMDVFSKAYFKDHFFENLLELARDPVAEVRIRLCRLAGRLKMVLTLPLDRPFLKLLENGIGRVSTGLQSSNLSLAEVASEARQTLEDISVDSIWGGNEATDDGFIEDQSRLAIEKANFAEDGAGGAGGSLGAREKASSRWKSLASTLHHHRHHLSPHHISGAGSSSRLEARASSGGSFKSKTADDSVQNKISKSAHGKLSGGSGGGGGDGGAGKESAPPGAASGKKPRLARRLSSLSKERLLGPRRGSFISGTDSAGNSPKASPSTKRKIPLLPTLASQRTPACAAGSGAGSSGSGLMNGKLQLGSVEDYVATGNGRLAVTGGGSTSSALSTSNRSSSSNSIGVGAGAGADLMPSDSKIVQYGRVKPLGPGSTACTVPLSSAGAGGPPVNSKSVRVLPPIAAPVSSTSNKTAP